MGYILPGSLYGPLAAAFVCTVGFSFSTIVMSDKATMAIKTLNVAFLSVIVTVNAADIYHAIYLAPAAALILFTAAVAKEEGVQEPFWALAIAVTPGVSLVIGWPIWFLLRKWWEVATA